MASDGASTHVAVKSSKEQSVDPAMVHKTSKALLKHLQESKLREDGHQKSRNLLESDGGLSEEVIWLIISTKKHITTHKRFKPTKISIPHSLNTSSTLSICLIVPDPQRLFKDIIANLASTPQPLSRITRVIDIKKLEKKYHSFESKRQLKASYDLFLVDDRVSTYLPKILGKTFFSSTSKRPIPVNLRPRKAKQEKRNAFLPIAKSTKDKPEPTSIIGPPDFLREIERTLSTTTANLSPSSTTSVRVGNASFTPDQLAENAEAIIEAMVNRSIPQKWRGLKAIHMKGPNSMALPVWLAEEMWEDEADVLEDSEVQRRRLESSTKKRKLETLEDPQNNSLRTMEGNPDTPPDQSVVRIKARKIDTKKVDQETKEQREQLRQHREKMRDKLNDPRQRSQVMAVS